MKFLFVHNNFPAQFRNVAEELRKLGSFELAAIGAQGAQAVEGVAVHRYQVPRSIVSATHPFARRFDAECWRAEQVLMAASALAASGFIPDFILAHSGWGEIAAVAVDLSEGENRHLLRILLSRGGTGRSLRS